MAAKNVEDITSTDVLQERIAELFMGVCADPDDAALADEADRALHRLDDLLAR